MITIYSRAVSAFATNCFLIVEKDGKEAALVDPGGDPDILSGMIEEAGVEVKYMLATHCHLDHIGAAAEMGRRLGTGLMAPEKDVFLLDYMESACQLYGLPPVEKPDVASFVEPGSTLPLGQSSLSFIEGPGHTPGSLLILADGKDLFAGDVMFMGSVGRTDLPGGDVEILKRTIKDVILPMDDDVNVHPGHGPSTTVGAERRTNHFVITWGLLS